MKDSKEYVRQLTENLRPVGDNIVEVYFRPDDGFLELPADMYKAAIREIHLETQMQMAGIEDVTPTTKLLVYILSSGEARYIEKKEKEHESK